jgi:hypothetical protein
MNVSRYSFALSNLQKLRLAITYESHIKLICDTLFDFQPNKASSLLKKNEFALGKAKQSLD